jgi:Zinc dependent phospholipase C
MGREPAGWPGLVIAAVFFALIFHARPAAGYSILAHEGLVDTLWADEIVPLLRDRFPGLTAADLTRARAYAYGGSLIQDLGYYPFGSHLFTNLTHYARTGGFIQSLIRNATTGDEYAFALGALAHYSADTAGHPIAVNRAVPLMYPKVRAEVGERALYVDSPVRHVMVEFGYDVLAVARGAYVAQAYRDRIGFEVSKPLLERAVRETYAIALGDLLFNVDLAIGTYRRAVSKTIPELTRIAWRDKRQEIEQRTPGITEQAFIFSLSPSDYDREFGTKYRKPGIFARILAFILKIVPKVGPLRPLAFEPLTAEVERLFLESETAARTRYRALLQELRSGRLVLPDADFDTGGPAAFGQNRLADETNADLLHKLAGRRFAGVSSELRRHFNGFFASTSPSREGASRKEVSRIRTELALMNGS